MNFNSNYNSPQFTAVTIKPHPNKWNKDVLKSALNSSTIIDNIRTNEKNGVDTTLKFMENTVYCPKNSLSASNMDFIVSGGNSRLALHSENCSAIYSSFDMPMFISKGPENLGEDVAKQIESLSETNDNKTIDEGLKRLKEIASDVIYEPIPEKHPEPIKEEPKGFFARLFS